MLSCLRLIGGHEILLAISSNRSPVGCLKRLNEKQYKDTHFGFQTSYGKTEILVETAHPLPVSLGLSVH